MINGFVVKNWLSKILFKIGISERLLILIAKRERGSIRSVNYHETLFKDKENFENQLKVFHKIFMNITEEKLQWFFLSKKNVFDKIGLIISFDDGLLSNYQVAAPLLEKYGFIGYFFIPVDFVNCSIAGQYDFAKEHHIDTSGHQRGERLAMNWEELEDLIKRGHVIGSHTMSHFHSFPEVSNNIKLQYEIVESKKVLEQKLKKPISSFCWVGGERGVYTPEAARIISEANYQFGFMTNCSLVTKKTDRLQIQRCNLSASWPLHLIHFQLSGIMDCLYYLKRKAVIEKTAV